MRKMLSLQQIISYYPSLSPDEAEQCLREYLQYKILKSVFASPWGNKLRFIGGTALRIIYGNARFSEDIDFDNDGTMSFDNFTALSIHIQKDLEKEGLQVLIRTIKKGAFHCNISIPELLYVNNLLPMRNQTILIQIDTVAQGYQYAPINHYLSKFDVQTNVLTLEPSLLLAQKLYTAFSRKRTKGRDFFDIIFLLGITKQPDYGYLTQKLGITNAMELKNYLIKNLVGLDLIQLQRDVAPFLFDPNDQSVALFSQIINQTTFA